MIVVRTRIKQIIPAPPGLVTSCDGCESIPVICLALVECKEYDRDQEGKEKRKSGEPPWEEIRPVDIEGEVLESTANMNLPGWEMAE